jgi:hypothetical protein
MSDRSVEIHKLAHAATEKFDYFVCGVCGALFGYIAQTYSPQKIESVYSMLEPLSLVFLAVSFFTGLRRIEHYNVLMRLNQKKLEAAEKVSHLTKQLSSASGTETYHLLSGEVCDVSTLETMRAEFLKEQERLESQAQTERPRVLRHYRLRNMFLLFGFVAIFAAKVLQPYQRAFPLRPISGSTKIGLSESRSTNSIANHD